MKSLSYLFIGILFGMVMMFSEAASWFRIYEMFQFKSFHMYGIIGSALVLGIVFIQIIKRNKSKTIYGEQINIPNKDKGVKRYLFGGILFGLGLGFSWGLPRSYVHSFRSRFLPYNNCYFRIFIRYLDIWIIKK